MSQEKDKLFGDVKIPLGVMIKRLFSYVKPETLSIIIAFLLIILNVATDIVFPMIFAEFTNTLTQPIQNMSLQVIIGTAVLYLVMGIINQVIVYFEAMILQRAGQRIIVRLRMEVFEHIQNMSINQFNLMPVGSLVTRVVNYTNSLSDLFTNTLVNLLRNILTILGVLGIMFYLSWKLTLVLCIYVVVIFVASMIFSTVVHKIFKRERQYLSDLNTYLSENLSGMKIIQIFNQEIKKEKEFNEKNDRLIKAKYQVTIAFGIYRPFISLLYILAIATIFGFGYYYKLNVLEITAFYYYLSKFFNPVQNISDQLNHVTRAMTASERLFNLLDVKPEVRDAEDAVEIDKFEGKIEFENVWFAYEEDNWILKDVSFIVEPKQTCAFVGATGAGKTTILSLIVRNFEIQKGRILIDGIDIKKIRIQSLRKAIGQMLQDVFLFSGSIKSNITLHDDSFTDEEVMAVCDYVNATSFIDKLPNKLEEQVIEKGENFSVGQRQLLSFARTVLHKPQILILDEATANIDTETEVLIQESLQKIKNIGTMLIVAHRLSTIQHSDKIIVLNKGEIIESGTHQELLKMHGHYYKLYQLQFEK